jgi:uncharacterized protein YtpQ (UPF0354 family)
MNDNNDDDKYKQIDTNPTNWKQNPDICPWGSLVEIVAKPDHQVIKSNGETQEDTRQQSSIWAIADNNFKVGDVGFVMKSFQNKTDNSVVLVFAEGPGKTYVYYTEDFSKDFKVVKRGTITTRKNKNI